MTMITTKIITIFLILAPLRMAAALWDCPGVPWLGAVAACRKASGSKFVYDLCVRMMREDGIDMSPSHKEEVTAYAILAAQDAANSYDKTQLAMSDQLDQNASSLPGPVRDAYEGCLNDYPAAEDSMDSAADGLKASCYFAELDDKYKSAIASLESCRDRLLSLKYSTTVYPMVLVDRDRVSLAYMLAKLVGI